MSKELFKNFTDEQLKKAFKRLVRGFRTNLTSAIVIELQRRQIFKHSNDEKI